MIVLHTFEKDGSDVRLAVRLNFQKAKSQDRDLSFLGNLNKKLCKFGCFILKSENMDSFNFFYKMLNFFTSTGLVIKGTNR